MTARTYPDGTRIDNEYSETGYLKAVKQGGGAYIQYALNLDGTGEYKNSIKRITGNGVETLIAFNPATMKLEAIESRNKSNTLLEQADYVYDNKTGNIAKINNTFDTGKTQTFEYDNLNRLKKAKGVYGEENYSYDPAGNLLKNAYGDLSYDDSTHPYAVTSDGEGNSYEYDANGQMTSGHGRDMEYDAAGRLVTLKKDGVKIQKNAYDHTGHRVLQEKKGGTLIFNIDGLYEIVKTPSRPDYHTKYIYGMEGDLASQVTTEGTALVAANFGHSFIFDKGYGSNPVISLLAKGYIKTDKFFSRAKNILKLQYVMVLIVFAMFAGSLVRSGIKEKINRLKNKRTGEYAQPAWARASSIMLVLALTGSFSLTGCDEIITGIGGGSSSSSSTTFSIEGLPTLGIYYFHPDHLGSVSYLTDNEGNVVTRMYYTPYGEKVKSASTGPDIFHQKYTGQVDDGYEAELLYYNARYYDPKLGRFISADSMVPDPGFSQSFNRYMYVYGNPINYNDPSGYSVESGAHGAGAAGAGSGGSAGGIGAGGSHGGNGGGYNDGISNVGAHVGSAYGGNIGHSTITLNGKPVSYGYFKTPQVNVVSKPASYSNDNNVDNDSADTDDNGNHGYSGHGDGGGLAQRNGIDLPISIDDYRGISDDVGAFQDWRKVRSHTGIDIIADDGTNVLSVIVGEVIFSGKDYKYGNYIKVLGEDGKIYLTAHLQDRFVKKGKMVKEGEVIGASGQTGFATGPHIHFEVLDLKNRPLNPYTGEKLKVIYRKKAKKIE